MGCFAATCGITNTAIFEGEEIIVVLFTNEFKESKRCQSGFYYLLDELVSEKRYRNTDSIHKQDPLVENILLGTYNDYGWTNEHKSERQRDHSHLFHKWAVELLLERPIGNIENPLDFVLELYGALYRLRKSPMDNQLLGAQHDGISEMKAQILLNKSTAAFLEKRVEECIKKGWEEEEED